MLLALKAATTVVTLLFIFHGILSQIRLNKRYKSTEGLSLSFYILAFLLPLCWAMFGLAIGDYFMVTLQLLGAAMTSIVLWQFWTYRKNKRPPPEYCSGCGKLKSPSDDGALDRWSDEGGK